MKNINMDLLLNIAFTFRLSLKELCKLLGRSETEEEQINLYNEIKEKYKENFSIRSAYKYLFNYESKNQSEKDAKKAYALGLFFLENYMIAKKEGNKVKINKMLNELNKIDNQFNELKKRKKGEPLTLEEILIISKYRLKYAIPREAACEYLDLTSSSVRHAEEKITDESLNKKLKNLSEYYLDIASKKRNVR